MWRQGCPFPAIANAASAGTATLSLITLFPNPTLKIPKRCQNLKKSIRQNSITLQNSQPKMGKEKKYWLLKTEPGEWSWDDQVANGGLSIWDGVKNKQAQKNMKSMRIGDFCFFYHSGSKARRVVGVVSVVREWYADDSGDGAVDVKAVGEMRRPVDLGEMKKESGLKGFGLLRQPRLSVVLVEKSMWERVCEMGGGFEGDGGDDEKSSGVL